VRSESGLKAVVGVETASTSPWPGPGDSEGPVDPVGLTRDAVAGGLDEGVRVDQLSLVTSAPWPGPGDSEGPVSGE
jgi:hypothetical protein